jgi:hypothetical protein
LVPAKFGPKHRGITVASKLGQREQVVTGSCVAATAFEAHIPTPEWAGSIFDAVERSRNVIMHSGTVDDEDIARVGINIRDWVKQVGA